MEIRDLLGSNDADKPFVPNFPVWKDGIEDTNNNNSPNNNNQGLGSQFLFSQTHRAEQPNPIFSQQQQVQMSQPGQQIHTQHFSQQQIAQMQQLHHQQAQQLLQQQQHHQQLQQQQQQLQQQHHQLQQQQLQQQQQQQQQQQHQHQQQQQPSPSQLLLQQVQMKSQMALNMLNNGHSPPTGSTSPNMSSSNIGNINNNNGSGINLNNISNISPNSMQKIQQHFQQQQQQQLLQFTQLQQHMFDQQHAMHNQPGLDTTQLPFTSSSPFSSSFPSIPSFAANIPRTPATFGALPPTINPTAPISIVPSAISSSPSLSSASAGRSQAPTQPIPTTPLSSPSPSSLMMNQMAFMNQQGGFGSFELNKTNTDAPVVAKPKASKKPIVDETQLNQMGGVMAPPPAKGKGRGKGTNTGKRQAGKGNLPGRPKSKKIKPQPLPQFDEHGNPIPVAASSEYSSGEEGGSSLGNEAGGFGRGDSSESDSDFEGEGGSTEKKRVKKESHPKTSKSAAANSNSNSVAAPSKSSKPKITFPYDMKGLTWDDDHQINTQKTYCYCGKDRKAVMIVCDICRQLFHTECVAKLNGANHMLGDWVYRFTCAGCKSEEQFERFAKNWHDVCEITLYNLIVYHKDQGINDFFQFKVIQGFVQNHWEDLCFGRPQKQSWVHSLKHALNNKVLGVQSFRSSDTHKGYWSLNSTDNPAIMKDTPEHKNIHLYIGQVKGRKGKNQVEESKKAIQQAALQYYIPGTDHKHVCLARKNSATQVRISEDLMSVVNDKGYRMARASFGVSEGVYYFEATIAQMSSSSHTRLGWSTQRGDKEGPVGYDKFSYSYRDQGDIFHQSRATNYGKAYAKGDVVGFQIKLPPNPHQKKSASLTKQVIFEVTSEPVVLEGSEITFYCNGECQGVAFTNIYGGTYYPAASMYMGAEVTFNFGPDFKYPPSENVGCFPVCDLAKQYVDPTTVNSFLNINPDYKNTENGNTRIPQNGTASSHELIHEDSNDDENDHEDDHSDHDDEKRERIVPEGVKEEEEKEEGREEEHHGNGNDVQMEESKSDSSPERQQITETHNNESLLLQPQAPTTNITTQEQKEDKEIITPQQQQQQKEENQNNIPSLQPSQEQQLSPPQSNQQQIQQEQSIQNTEVNESEKRDEPLLPPPQISSISEDVGMDLN